MWLRLCFKKVFNKRQTSIMTKRLKTDKTFSNSGHQSSGPQNYESQGEVDMSHSNIFSRMTSPTKSFSDCKEYSVIQLPNGLKALLISDKSDEVPLNNPHEITDSSESECSESDNEISSDEDEMSVGSNENDTRKSTGSEEKLAACALCIGVGSFSDPKNIPGLAHFLEHMIFMGSEKFPTENAFDIYIKKKGGSDNAYTECEYTTFYFDCHEKYLHNGLEIFSELFVSPLMKRDTMTKEREAIESEFKMALPKDGSRRSQLLCSLADLSNPSHKFMWGNLKTLRDNITDDELYSALHEFRNHHYSAHRMTLAIQARLPIETLEKMVVDCFQNVPNNGLPPDEFMLTVPPFKQDEFSKLYTVEPVKDIDHLYLTWVMPSTLRMYKTKPLSYLSWVIGHEGKGSLHSYLRKKLWCTGISVNDGGDGTEDNSLYTLFSIALILTQEGIKHIEEILNSLFLYLKMFQENGPQQRLFEEIQLIAETSFRYSEEVPSSDNVEQLSENMHFYPPSDYITGSELYFEYDYELLKSFLMKLRPDKVNIMVYSKLIASSENLDKIEPWFGTKYKSKNIPSEWIMNWENSKDYLSFHLPEKNKFIANNFTILPTPDHVAEFPSSIVKDEMLELWYKQDTTFKLPHAFCCLHLVSPLSHSTAQNSAMLDLFICILKQYLSEELYPANVAGLEYEFHSGEKGMIISINGFNDKLKDVLLVIINGIKSLCYDLKQDLAEAMKEELKREYSNHNLKTTYLGRDLRMSLLLKTFWTALDKGNALNNVTYDMLKEFIIQYLQQLFIQCLIQGNISREEAVDLSLMVKESLKYKPILDNTIPKIRVFELPKGERYCIVKSFNVEDANSLVTNYYQSGLGTIQESCIIEFLLMMMDEPLFDSLRTQQQLGYDVSCTLRDTFGILGFSISVHCQSDRNSVEFVESRITQFLKDFLEILQKTTQAEFEEVQESLIKLKMCKDIHLKEEVKRNWDEIKSEEYIFDRHHKEKDLIEKLTLEEVIKCFEKISGLKDQSKFKKLSTQIVGKASVCKNTNSINEKLKCEKGNIRLQELDFIPQQETSDKFIFNITDFKKSLYLYPFHKTS